MANLFLGVISNVYVVTALIVSYATTKLALFISLATFSEALDCHNAFANAYGTKFCTFMSDMWTGKNMWWYGPPLDTCLSNVGIDMLTFQKHKTGTGPCDGLKKLGNDLGGLYDAADDCQQ